MQINLRQASPKPQTLEEAQKVIDALWGFLLKQEERIAALEKQIAELQEKSRTNSNNSSKPPSTDLGRSKGVAKKMRSGKKAGGQPGHVGRGRELCESHDVIVQVCPPQPVCECGGAVHRTGLRSRHQNIELPKIIPVVTEYQVYAGECCRCGKSHQGRLPPGVRYALIGPGLLALIGTLTGGYRLSKRLTQGLLHDVCGVRLSLGLISQSEAVISTALGAITAQAHDYIKAAPVVHCDETGHKECADRRWMWVAIAGLVSVFLARAGRATKEAQELLGASFGGIAVTDRHGAYNWIDTTRRQLCWAHLLRDFTKIAERSGEDGRIGALLIEHTKRMFRYWHHVKNNELTQAGFVQVMDAMTASMEQTLQRGVDTGQSKTANTCRRLLKARAALWTFVHTPGVEPTNNIAERTIRHYVIWRKISLGTQSVRGSLYAERVMTVVGSCKLQGRSVLAFMTQAMKAHFGLNPTPSLIPIGVG